MSKILISYRRDDSSDVTGRIYDRLVTQFGREAVFTDVDSIPLGVDFRTYLDEQVSKCSVFLAVIGREWIRKRGSKRKSPLDDPKDFVRIEIESALKRRIPVIPLLVRGASIPKEESLPASMKDLAYRHGIPVRSDPDFHNDMDRLIEHLTGHLRLSKAPTPQQSSEPQSQEAAGGEVTLAKAPANMVLIPKGPFLYGDAKITQTIEKDFYIDIYPVTNQQYDSFIRAGGYDTEALWSKVGWGWKKRRELSQPKYWGDPEWNQPDHPVVGVTYFEAEAFAKWAGKRLPTEQEWEKAARGTHGLVYPWGDQFDKERCNSEQSGIKGTTPVTKYVNGVSPYGCYDMAGNVWEWTSSWKGDLVVLRGGSWCYGPVYLRCSEGDAGASRRYSDRNDGFRCAQDAS